MTDTNRKRVTQPCPRSNTKSEDVPLKTMKSIYLKHELKPPIYVRKLFIYIYTTSRRQTVKKERKKTNDEKEKENQRSK